MPIHAIEELSESQIVDLHQLYQNEWWTEGRSLDDVRIMVANTDLTIGLVDEQQKLVAFCRVLTDFVFRATIYDVIVADSERGTGLGRLLMDTLVDDPRLHRVSKITLNCRPEMISFYKKWGFDVASGRSLAMNKVQRAG